MLLFILGWIVVIVTQTGGADFLFEEGKFQRYLNINVGSRRDIYSDRGLNCFSNRLLVTYYPTLPFTTQNSGDR